MITSARATSPAICSSCSGAGTFELPYGYAWLLRLQYELGRGTIPTPCAGPPTFNRWRRYMSERMIAYLKALQQPVRTGVHPNTAMAMDNALGYARRVRSGVRGRDSLVGRALVQARHSLQHRGRAGAERFRVAVFNGSGDYGTAHGSRRRSSRGSTHSCRRSIPPNSVRSRRDWGRSS